MAPRRVLIRALLLSLLGHLLILTTFSVAAFKMREKPLDSARLLFLGELPEGEVFPRLEVVLGEREPELEARLGEIEMPLGLSLSKPLTLLPSPQVSREEILLPLRQRETSLLQLEMSREKKEAPPKRPRLLEREPGE